MNLVNTCFNQLVAETLANKVSYKADRKNKGPMNYKCNAIIEQ